MTEFLSEENIALHKEYVRKKRLQFSILESSLPELRGVGAEDIFNIRLKRRDREDAIRLLSEIDLHDIFFSSFSEEKHVRSMLVTERYGSEAAFLNELYRLCKNSDYGFLIVMDGARASVVTDYPRVFMRGRPRLAIDLCEHAYLIDYGFDKERYLISCLSYLDLSKL